MARLFLAIGALVVCLASAAPLTRDAAVHQLRADPKEEEAKKEEPAKKDGDKGGKKEDLMKKMPLKAAEQGVEGKKVQHKDGETAAADWQNEYGDEPKPEPAPVVPKKSG